MKVNHHQIKNVIAHVSQQLESKLSNKKLQLLDADYRTSGWSLRIDEPKLFDDMYSRTPSYFARLAEIGTDESISLDSLYIETHGIGNVIDAGFGFMNHADKISTVSLVSILPANSYMKHYPSWRLRYSGLDNKQAEIEMNLHISNQGVIFDVELEYTKAEKARELAENFIKQSNEILNATKNNQHHEQMCIHGFWYAGFNQQGEAINLHLRIDAENETILSHEITVLKSNNK